MSLDFITYPDREMLTLSLANKIAGQLGQHLRSHDRASLCLPGGSSPAPVFDALSASDIDWSRVTVFLGDERWVDGSHNRSNSRILRRNLLKDRAEAAEYIDLYTGDEGPEQAVPTLISQITDRLPITVLLLGMGNDMHTASLFPNRPETEAALASDAPLVSAVQGVGDEARITLTPAALKGAFHTHLLIMGPEKREALERAQSLPPLDAPIRTFLNDITVHWAN